MHKNFSRETRRGETTRANLSVDGRILLKPVFKRCVSAKWVCVAQDRGEFL
jgi:hypothetical protein